MDTLPQWGEGRECNRYARVKAEYEYEYENEGEYKDEDEYEDGQERGYEYERAHIVRVWGAGLGEGGGRAP